MNPLDRAARVTRGKRLAYFTIAWNSLEGVVSVAAGLAAGSISLVGFGIDSFVEVTSGAAVLWRMHVDPDHQNRERNERVSLRVIGACFLLLAAYVAYESIGDLLERRAPERSLVGIAMACASVIVMPLLAREKRRVATALASRAVGADARQTDFCLYLSVILLVGLVLNAAAGVWWADPVAALIMTPIIAREGVMGLRAETCSDCCS